MLANKEREVFCVSMEGGGLAHACSKPGFPVLYCLWSLLKLMPIESVTPYHYQF